MEEGRSDDGRFTPEHTDGEILAAVRTHEPAATSEVAGELDMTRQGADRRLRRLREAGRVNSKKIGASLVWFDADAGDAESGREPDVTPSPDTGGGSAPSSTPSGARDAPAVEEDLDAEDTLAESVRAYLEEHDGPETDHGRDAVVDVFRVLRKETTAKTSELRETVYPAYTEKWGDSRTMWNTLTRDLADVPGIEKGGYGEWTYTGDADVRATLEEER